MYIFKSVLEEVIGDALLENTSTFTMPVNASQEIIKRANELYQTRLLVSKSSSDEVIIYNFSDNTSLEVVLVNRNVVEIKELKEKLVAAYNKIDILKNGN